MPRLEPEITMLEERLPIKELPTVWNDKMQEYLGIVPCNNTQGVLQNIHWSLEAVLKSLSKCTHIPYMLKLLRHFSTRYHT
jgi:hypothetical protein